MPCVRVHWRGGSCLHCIADICVAVDVDVQKVVHDGNTHKIGETMINNQVQVLNDAYNGASSSLGVQSYIQFTLDRINYIDNGE